MRSLRRRGVSFFHIFLHDKKDMAAGGTSSTEKNQVGKYVKPKFTYYPSSILLIASRLLRTASASSTSPAA